MNASAIQFPLLVNLKPLNFSTDLMKYINLNSYLLAALLGLVTWMGKEVYFEIRSTHDAVLKMVPRDEFNVEITQIKVRLAALEWEISKTTPKHP